MRATPAGLRALHRAVVALAAVCAVAAPPGASAQSATAHDPEWLRVESPGAAGFGFGLGIDLGWEDLDSLANAAATTTVTTRDADGREVTQVIPGDPALANRKFDFRFHVETAGGQAPIALPTFSLGGAVTVFPSLVIEVAVTDVTFHFDDRTNPEDSTSITARGTSYGLGLESVAALGSSKRWYLAAGYRYRDLPSLELERSPPFDPFTGSGPVTHDEVRLSQATHLATLRVGRAFRGGRFNPYLGLRGRWTELEIEDELAFGSPLGDETALRTRARYDSESALGVAGVDARLGGPVLGRAEVTFGDGGDAAVLLKTVVRLRPGTAPPPPPPQAIAEAFDRLRRELEREAERLEPQRATQPELYVSRVLALLDRIEAEGVAVLLRYDYVALADWLRDRFDEARAEVRTEPASEADLRDLWPPPAPRPAVRFASLLGPAPRAQGNDGDDGREERSWLGKAFDALSLIFIRAEERCLEIKVRFVITGVSPTNIAVFPRNEPTDETTFNFGKARTLRIGSYAYEIELSGRPVLNYCYDRSRRNVDECPLDLVKIPVEIIGCHSDSNGPLRCEPDEDTRYDHCPAR